MGPTHRKWSHPASHDTRDLQSRPLQTLATVDYLLGHNKLSFRTFTTSGPYYMRIEVDMQRRRSRPCPCLPRSSECLFPYTSEVACEHFLSLLFLLPSLMRGRFVSSLSLSVCLSLCLSLSLSVSLCLSLSLSVSLCLCLCLSLSVSVTVCHSLSLSVSVFIAVFDAVFTRSGPVPNGRRIPTGQLVPRSSQGLVPCGRRSGVSGQRNAQEFSPLLSWSSTVSPRCLGDRPLASSEPPEECVQSRAEPPAELHGHTRDSNSSFRFSVFALLRFLRWCCGKRHFLRFGVMESFSIDDCEVETNVRQSRVSPCVHVNPWFREPFRSERRDNHLSLRFKPRLATGVVNDVATHIVQLCSVSSDEALLRVLSLLVKFGQTPGSCCGELQCVLVSPN